MSGTILIVDEDPLVRRLITTTLQDVGGFGLREAGDGHEALEAALYEPPEIVFLDYSMPRLDGVETCRRLRSYPATAGATIVMLSEVEDAASHDRAVAAGADVFLAKPFSPLHLLRLVDSIGAAGG